MAIGPSTDRSHGITLGNAKEFPKNFLEWFVAEAMYRNTAGQPLLTEAENVFWQVCKNTQRGIGYAGWIRRMVEKKDARNALDFLYICIASGVQFYQIVDECKPHFGDPTDDLRQLVAAAFKLAPRK